MKALRWKILFLLLLLASAFTSNAEGKDRLLARWRGGELRESGLLERYPPGRTLEGEALETAICKASFREIYGALAHQEKVESSANFRREMEDWKRRYLASTWRSRQQEQIAAGLTKEDIDIEWQRRSASGGDFHPSARLDVDIVFLPCGLQPAIRQACRDEAGELDRRLAAGEEFSKLAFEQREHGRASGHFQDISLAILSADLRHLVEATPVTQLSRWLEAPHGLFRLQLLARRAGREADLAAFEPKLRQDLIAAKLDDLVEVERRGLGLAADLPSVDVMVQAALRLGLDKEPSFSQREAENARWVLADQAFLADPGSLPSGEELAATLKARQDEFEEVELEILLLDVKDQPATLARAGEVEELLNVAGEQSTEERFRGLPRRFPELRRQVLGPLRLQKLGRIVPELEKVLATLPAGGWLGPIPLAEKDLSGVLASGTAKSTRHASYETLAFVHMARRSLPPLDAVRQELYQDAGSRLGSGIPYFVAVMNRRWGFELLPSEDAADHANP